MISDGQKWHYLVVKNLSILLREITSNHIFILTEQKINKKHIKKYGKTMIIVM